MHNDCLYDQRLFNAVPIQPPSILALFFNQFLLRLGLGAYWGKTFYGLQIQLRELILAGEKEQALNLLVKGLKNAYFWPHYSHKWWALMGLAMQLIQDNYLTLGSPAESQLRILIKLYANAPLPWQGAQVAYHFAALSLWCFQLGKVQKAIEYVQVAIHADPQWGYPAYLFGWYGLQLKGIDPIPHFAKAIQQNAHFLYQLQQDPLCQSFPKMIKAVKQFLLYQTKLPLT